MQSVDEQSQVGYVTFKDSQGAETAALLTGATIVDLAVTITPDPDYKLPQAVLMAMNDNRNPAEADSALRKAEDVVSGMIAKGFILGKDAVNKAKSLDEKHQLTSTGLAKVASFDKKLGLSDKITASTTVVGDKVREVDQKYQVSEKTKSAFAVAEQKVSSAGSAIMKNRYVFTSAAWVTGAFSKVAKAAEDVGQKAKEKVGMAEEEQRRKVVEDYAHVHLSDSPSSRNDHEQQSEIKYQQLSSPPDSPPSSKSPSKPAPVTGLVL
ncbi:Binding partner of ACD11 1 [Linum perenne]